MEQQETIGEILIRSRVIDQEQLEKALVQQANLPIPRPRLGLLVVEMGFATEAQVATALAERYGVPFTDLDQPPPEPGVLAIVPRRLAQRGMLVPLAFDGEDGLVIAMADPTNVVAVDDVRMVTRAQRVSVKIASAGAIKRAHAEWYRFDETITTAAHLPDDGGDNLYASLSANTSEDLEWIMRQADTAPIVRMVANIQQDAVRAGATDIHIEPGLGEVRVRFRVDGMLRDVLALPKRAHAGLVSRIKILSGMDIAERRRPQDGRSTLTFGGRTFDLRLSTIPTPHGEKVAIRLLPQGNEQIVLSDLGLEYDDLVLLERHL